MRLSQSWEKHSVSYHWRVSFVHLFAADYPDMLKTFPFDSSVLRDRCHIFSNTFSSSKKYLHCFFFFLSLNTVNYIAWSSSDKPILHSWDKPCFFFLTIFSKSQFIQVYCFYLKFLLCSHSPSHWFPLSFLLFSFYSLLWV